MSARGIRGAALAATIIVLQGSVAVADADPGATSAARPTRSTTSAPSPRVTPSHRKARVPASAPQVCQSTDNGDPLLKTLTFSPTTVDAREGPVTVTVRVTADDTGGPGAPSGVGQVSMEIGFRTDLQLHPSIRQAPDGSFVGRFVVLPQFGSGAGSVFVSVVDRAGHQTQYSSEDLSRLGLPFTVTTLTQARDDDPPVALAFRRPATVDTRRQEADLLLSVRATDRTGVASVRALLTRAPFQRDFLPFTLISGSRVDGVWQARLRIPRWVGHRRIGVHIDLADLVSNSTRYNPASLSTIGPHQPLRLISRTDPSPPALRLRQLRPDPLDVRTGRRRITVEAVITDRGSGARAAGLSMQRPPVNAPGYPVLGTQLTLTAGTRHAGTWTGSLRLTRCQAVGGRWNLTLFAADRTSTSFVHRSLIVRNVDVVPPSAHSTSVLSVPTGGPMAIRFDQDVRGVTPDNIAVVSSLATAPIDGAWTCRSSRDVPVDCGSGPVRTASYTPTAPLAPATGHAVQLNPEHHLGLTDLAGNPALPRDLVTFQTE
jgi:hypothetical protein